MLGIENFGVFLAAGIALNLTPGPDTFYILARAGADGVRVGLWSALGISSGCIVHTLLAAFGLSAVLMSSPIAFAVVKYVGAAYLMVLGVRMLIASWRASEPSREAQLRGAGAGAAFRQGFLTNVFNPKVALFFLAFLPQFIDPRAAHAAFGFLVLGLSFIATGTVWCVMLALMGGSIGNVIKRNPGATRWIDRVTASVFIGLGARLALVRA